jgi:hypothetical protein
VHRQRRLAHAGRARDDRDGHRRPLPGLGCLARGRVEAVQFRAAPLEHPDRRRELRRDQCLPPWLLRGGLGFGRDGGRLNRGRGQVDGGDVAQVRHMPLQRVHRGHRRRLTPDDVGQPARTHHLAAVQGQGGQHCLAPYPGDWARLTLVQDVNRSKQPHLQDSPVFLLAVIQRDYRI